jgi:DNA modification methylase
MNTVPAGFNADDYAPVLPVSVALAYEAESVADYTAFLASKRLTLANTGFHVTDDQINPVLFNFQRDLVRWAIRKGRAAIFADTGLGKTLMQIEWARLVSKQRALIIAPLSVAHQTIREAKRLLGIDVVYSRGDTLAPLTITNYEMIEHFDPSDFDAVVLDESSILKSLDGKTRQRLTEMFGEIPFRLCCTATPAPNDITEIANHAEFLGIMSRAEMLSAFFIHDSSESARSGWRLKGHAIEPFYKWLASWGMSVRKPSDLGYSDDGFDLPELNIEPLWVEADWKPQGQLFHMGLHGIQDRHNVRKATLDQRIDAAVELVGQSPGQWILWCGLNNEANRLAERIDSCINVQGSDSPEHKAKALDAFQAGEYRVLITKPRIAGFGMNFQNCHQMGFIGLSDSWESYYQCIRRCWRFGQVNEVTARIVLSNAEEDIYHNVMSKEIEATEMISQLIAHVAQYEREEIEGIGLDYQYETDTREGSKWRMMLGDSCERMAELESESVDLSVFSPPFLSLYTYSPTERDVGNSRTEAEFYHHFGRIIEEAYRVTKEGRNCAVHVQEVTATLNHDGYIGLKDFSGGVIRQFQEQGWIYHGRVTIDKDPQAQAIRTHSKSLLFVQLHKDSVWSRPALADYILIFRKPGDNAVPVIPDLSNDEWIEWARPIWYGIRESDTLNAAEGRDHRDERHVAALQLATIERCVRLWTNPGETVLSPFAGIGSEGYVSVKNGRQFVGIELKRSYFDAACRNLMKADAGNDQRLL